MRQGRVFFKIRRCNPATDRRQQPIWQGCSLLGLHHACTPSKEKYREGIRA